MEHHDGLAVTLGILHLIQGGCISDGIYFAVEAHFLAEIPGYQVSDHVGVAGGGCGTDDNTDILAL